MSKMFFDIVMYSQLWKKIFFDIDTPEKWVSMLVPGTQFQRSLIFLVCHNFALWLWCKNLPGRNTLAYFFKMLKMFYGIVTYFEKHFSLTLTLWQNEWIRLSLEHISSIVLCFSSSSILLMIAMKISTRKKHYSLFHQIVNNVLWHCQL
jgi:hypothetical protein